MVSIIPLTIPVIFADRPGFESVAGAFKSPVIKIGLGYDISALSEGKLTSQSKIVSATALLDTGADDFVVDQELLNAIGAPLSGKTTEIKTVHQTTIVQKRTVHLFIKEFDLCAEIDVIPMKLSDDTRAYQAIFGLRFLEIGKLTIDMRGESSFTLHQ